MGCGRGTVWKLKRVKMEGEVIRSDTGYGIEVPKVMQGYLNEGIIARRSRPRSKRPAWLKSWLRSRAKPHIPQVSPSLRPLASSNLRKSVTRISHC